MSTKKYSILFTAEMFAPDLPGGSGRWLHEAAKALVARGHQATLLMRKCKPSLSAQETIDTIRVIRYGSGGEKNVTTGLSSFQHGNRLASQLIDQEGFDVIHVQQPYSGFVTLFKTPRTIPVVYTFHSPWHKEWLIDKQRENPRISDIGYWVRYVIEWWVILHSRRIIVLSDFMMNLVQLYHKLGNRCVKIPGGIDITRFSPPESKEQVRQELGIAPHPLLLFTARNLRQRMGLFQLIDAIA